MEDVKLDCPICNIVFITHKSNKKYCSDFCREAHNLIRQKISGNEIKKEMMNNDKYLYDIKEDKFYIKAFLKTKL